MSNPNARVAVMIARTIGNRRSCPRDPVYNTITGTGMIYGAIRNMSSRHGYPTDNASGNWSSRHGYPPDSASTASAGKPTTVYVRKNQ